MNHTRHKRLTNTGERYSIWLMKEEFPVGPFAFFAFLLVFALIVSTFGGIAGLPARQLYAAGGTFGGGNGTPGDPYQIEDVDDLQAMGSNLTAYYVLNNSIDASATSGWNSGQGFEPVGNSARFSGGFDGGGFNITGLYINRPATNNVGLFGHVGDDTGATVIKNVRLANTTVVGARGTGTLIGRVTGNANTLIENCSAVGGNVTGNGATGGLIGSFNSWQTTLDGTDNPVLRYSYSDVAVYSSASGGRDKFGGLVGCSQKGTIQNSYSRSSVNVTDGSRIGGLAGCIDYRGEIFNSYSTGLVTVTSCVLVGGLVGNRVGPGFNEGVVTNSFWDTETSGQTTSAGGTGKNTTEMKTEATFTDAGWNFVDIWHIDSGVNDDYPHLIWTGFVPTELTITGTFTAQNKAYDAMNNATINADNLTLSGVSGSDNVTLVDVTIRFSDPYVANNKTVNITSAALNGTDASKYMLSLVGAPAATADITAKPIDPFITANDKVYDGTTTATLSAQGVSGVIGSDDVSLVAGAANFTDKNAGSNKTVTATGLSLAGAAAGNYTLSAANAIDVADITQQPITVTADDKSKVYGQVDPALTYQVTGYLAAGDDFTGSLARQPGEALGSYDILQGTLAIADGNNGNNYNLIFVWGTFTINVDPPRYALIIRSTEGGRVTKPGEGIYTYDARTLIKLEATPDAGYRFVEWTGNVDTVADVNAASTTITMNGHYAIKANFEVIPPTQYNLTISSTDGGSLTAPGEGTFVYEEGTVVNLVATPDARYQFAKWSGDVAAIANVNAASTTITMNADHSVKANFEAIAPPKYNLTISSTDGGSVVTPGEGTFAYYEGTVVTLAATPDILYQFVNWSGDVSRIANPNAASTTITMDSSHSINANFSGGGCFIATAAYGTPMAEEIQVLRDFRDEYLLTNPAGQALVGLYYRVSPPMAEFITEHPSLKPIVRTGLLPAVALSTIAVKTSLAEKAGLIGLLVLVTVAVTIWATRRRGKDAGYA
jgi:hypothetical protein